MSFRLHFLLFILALLLTSLRLLAQHQRPDRFSLGFGANLILTPIGNESGSMDFSTGSSFSFAGQYYKTLHPHLDIKGGVGWQGIAGSALGEGIFSSGNIKQIEVLPLYYTNPDKQGYVPAKYQFYMGAGIGGALVSRSGVRELDLDENDRALVEFGLLEAQESQSQRFSIVYFPFTFGVIQRTKGVWHIGYEATLNVSLPQQVGQNDFFLPAWAQISVILGRKR